MLNSKAVGYHEREKEACFSALDGLQAPKLSISYNLERGRKELKFSWKKLTCRHISSHEMPLALVSIFYCLLTSKRGSKNTD